MAIQSGLYKASFAGPYGSGSGIVTVTGDKFSGGDDAIAYLGTLSEDGNSGVNATLKTFRHGSPDVSSVLGRDDVTITLSGKIQGDGSVILRADNVNFVVKLDRLAA